MKNIILLTTLLAAVLTFTQCHSIDDEDCICYEIYSPVCGDDGILYGNDCLAECAGVSYTPGFCPEEQDALVLYLGDPAIDGCGWVVQFTGENALPINYRPDTLMQAFKIDSLSVHLDYKLTLQSSACSRGGQITFIEILDIEAL